jgi:hypothetical protein
MIYCNYFKKLEGFKYKENVKGKLRRGFSYVSEIGA